MPSDNPACADCKAKKKRCIHRNQPVKVAKVEAVSASMSAPSATATVLTPASTPVPVAVAGSSTRGRRKTADATTKVLTGLPLTSGLDCRKANTQNIGDESRSCRLQRRAFFRALGGRGEADGQ